MYIYIYIFNVVIKTRVERTMNLLEGGEGRVGRGRREGGEGTWGREGGRGGEGGGRDR